MYTVRTTTLRDIAANKICEICVTYDDRFSTVNNKVSHRMSVNSHENTLIATNCYGSQS